MASQQAQQPSDQRSAGPAGSDADRSRAAEHITEASGGVDRVGMTLAERLDVGLVRLDSIRDRPSSMVIVVAVIVAVVGAGWWLGRPGRATPVEAGIPFVTVSTTESALVAASEPTVLLVHVAGAVHEPGIVSLDPGSRIGDAVAAAGGPSADADLHRLNLAAPVSDGLQIRVPVEGEVVSPTGVGPEADASSPALVNVNTASTEELERLTGIGPALAAAIVARREEHGPFSSVDELLAVPGIGPSKLAGFSDQVVF